MTRTLKGPGPESRTFRGHGRRPAAKIRTFRRQDRRPVVKTSSLSRLAVEMNPFRRPTARAETAEPTRRCKMAAEPPWWCRTAETPQPGLSVSLSAGRPQRSFLHLFTLSPPPVTKGATCPIPKGGYRTCHSIRLQNRNLLGSCPFGVLRLGTEQEPNADYSRETKGVKCRG